MKNEEWKILMKESPTATWFQSEEAWTFFNACAQWLIPFHTEVKRGDEVVGMVTGYISKEKYAWKQRFSCRAVINGGPLLRADATTAEVRELLETTETEIKRLSKGQIIYIETRNFVDLSPWREAFEQAGWEYQAHYDIHVDCSDEEAMWERFHESKKRALWAEERKQSLLRSGSELPKERPAGYLLVESESERGGMALKQWYALLSKLYKTKVKRPLWPQAFFERAIEMGVGKLLVIGGEAEGAKGGMFVVEDEKRVYEWYVVGPVGATYAGLHYAAQQHKPIFDFMGAGEPGKPYGVRDFKMQFGGELKELGRWVRVCKHGYYNLGKLLVNANILG